MFITFCETSYSFNGKCIHSDVQISQRLRFRSDWFDSKRNRAPSMQRTHAVQRSGILNRDRFVQNDIDFNDNGNCLSTSVTVGQEDRDCSCVCVCVCVCGDRKSVV